MASSFTRRFSSQSPANGHQRRRTGTSASIAKISTLFPDRAVVPEAVSFTTPAGDRVLCDGPIARQAGSQQNAVDRQQGGVEVDVQIDGRDPRGIVQAIGERRIARISRRQVDILPCPPHEVVDRDDSPPLCKMLNVVTSLPTREKSPSPSSRLTERSWNASVLLVDVTVYVSSASTPPVLMNVSVV